MFIQSLRKKLFFEFGTKMLPGRFIGYALKTGGGWNGDFIIADQDIENNLASEVHVKKVQVQRSRNEGIAG